MQVRIPMRVAGGFGLEPPASSVRGFAQYPGLEEARIPPVPVYGQRPAPVTAAIDSMANPDRLAPWRCISLAELPQAPRHEAPDGG
jgi:hypothetical protein